MIEKPKILIVDDNINNIYVIEELLSEMDVEITRAMSGLEAIKIASSNDIALVLMDIQMPGMDGFETVEMIRKNKKNELLNIIYITAVSDESSFRARGVKTGAVDFITKPLIPDLFIGKVAIFLNLYKQRKELEEEILKRKETEKELQNSKEIAEEAALMKQRFLSNMSHEIRTPLNAIINSANLLLYEGPRDDQLDNMEILKFAAESLLHLINGILDYSKIDSGKVEFESIEFEIRKLLHGIQGSFDPEVMKKGLELNLEVDEDVPALVYGDPGRLSQILFNLVGNAVKFTEKGKVSIKVGVLHHYTDDSELIFHISDTGIGIPEDKQQQIFEVFTQAASSTTRKYGGTGLGLSISRMLVEMQGGRLQLQSTVNRGSTFSFSLTFKKSSREPSQLESVTNPSFLSLNGLNILVVEDNPINQKIVCKLLAKWNAQTDIAENGLIALEKVRHNHYHLILMDLHMPEMNGYEAATKIREMEGDYYKFMPILALTASAFIEDRNKIFTHGMSGYIIKPFSPAELNWKISKFVHDNSPVI